MSQFKAPNPGKIVLTRMELLQYMHQRAWFKVAQYNLCFTLVLWVVFIVQILMRADVEDAFRVKDGIVQHIQHVIAHPTMSGVPFIEQVDAALPCRCACRSAKHGTPPSVCSTPGAEVLDFMGTLSENVTAGVLASACSDVDKPLAGFFPSVTLNFSNFSCPDWLQYMEDALGSRQVAQRTLCTDTAYKAFLQERSTLKEWVNDTDSHFLYRSADFKLARWKCPATCGACQYNIGNGMKPLAWSDINSVEDAWLWVEHGLLPDIFNGQTNNPAQSRPGILARRNLLIGGLRARQLRSKEPFACDVNSAMQQVYSPTCRSPDPATDYLAPGLAGSPAQQLLEATGAYSLASGDEEGAFDVFFEVERNRSVAQGLATQLRKAKWLNAATTQLRVEGVALNPEAGFFGLVKIIFDFRYDGVVDLILQTNSLQIITSFSVMDYIPEFIWLALIGILLLEEIMEISRACFSRTLKAYATDAWNWIDWLSILLGAAFAMLWFFIVQGSVALADKVIALPRVVPTDATDLKSYRTAWTGLLDDAQGLQSMRAGHLALMFLFASIITLRFLKGFLGQQKLAMIQNSLVWAAKDVLHFMIAFVVMFVTFVVGGHVLFGVALKEWSTITNALSSTIKMLMGAFQYQAMYDYAPWSATVWFWLFLFSMVFLMLNLLTAIMVIHFGKLRRVVGPTDMIFSDAWEGLKDFIWRSEWRWDNIMMREFTGATQNPYEDLIEGISEKAKISKNMEEMMQKTVLGMRLACAQEDIKSLLGLQHENKDHPAVEPVKEKVMQKELRTIGCDATVADHVIVQCDKYTKTHAHQAARLKNMEVEKARLLLKMLQSHSGKLSHYCEQIESGVNEEMTSVIEGLEVLESSISEAFGGLLELRQTEVDSLALCPPRLPYAGTSVRDAFMTSLGHQPPRKGTAPVPGRGGHALEFDLRETAESEGGFYSLCNDFGSPQGLAQTALPAAAALGNGPSPGGQASSSLGYPPPPLGHEQLALPNDAHHDDGISVDPGDME